MRGGALRGPAGLVGIDGREDTTSTSRSPSTGAADDPVVYAKLKELTSPRTKPAATTARDYFPPPESQGGWRQLNDPDRSAGSPAWTPTSWRSFETWLLEVRRSRLRRGRHPTAATSSSRSRTRQQRQDRLAPRRLGLQGRLRHGAGDRLGAEPAGLTAAEDDVRRPGVRFHSLGAAAERPAQGADHRQATAQSHLGHLSRSHRRAERRPGNMSSATPATRGPRSWRSTPAPPAATRRTRSTTPRWSARRSPASLTTSSPSRRCSSRSASSIGGFSIYDGGTKYGRHPSHGLGMPARDLARIAYCMLRDGRWEDRQVIPQVVRRPDRRADPRRQELRNCAGSSMPQIFSHGWELPRG